MDTVRYTEDEKGALPEQSASLKLDHLHFERSYNSADYGGAISYKLMVSSPRIATSSFQMNNASTDGGCIYFESSISTGTSSQSAMFYNSVFHSNSAGDHGGAIAASYPSSGITNFDLKLLLFNCEFTQNNAKSGGAASLVYIGNGTFSLAMHFCTVADNSASSGGAVYLGDGYAPTYTPFFDHSITNSIFWGNTAQNGDHFDNEYTAGTITIPVTRSNIEGGCENAGTITLKPNCSTTIDSNPLFDTPTYRLLEGSQSLNVGGAPLSDTFDLDNDGDEDEPTPYDLDGNPRVVGISVDMGAYEYQQ